MIILSMFIRANSRLKYLLTNSKYSLVVRKLSGIRSKPPTFDGCLANHATLIHMNLQFREVTLSKSYFIFTIMLFVLVLQKFVSTIHKHFFRSPCYLFSMNNNFVHISYLS